ncbi:hypothetical protein QYE76_070014 [Lolium multiflorum]|uniref:F-box domain-containing protein n=1 Tax=Lolium multiflorum TaxID=4521 RepID=A0AAD8SIE4_LOLMU|nr:hypothetical protein QYE76_070014 [Lolium multiflorum]
MAPPHRGLPDEIAIWEILIRLDIKALLRCRAVCRAWLRATSTLEFLVVHHGCQPTLPLLSRFDGSVGHRTLDIIPLDHKTGLVAADQLQSIARLDDMHLLRSCDSLLILCTNNKDDRHYAICNPATRQYAPLRQIDDFEVSGMYLHRSTGEYRLLLYPCPAKVRNAELPHGLHDGCHVFTLGSCEPPRHIGWPEAREVMFEANMLFHGSLLWYMGPENIKKDIIRVFDTTAESFRHMQAPVLPGPGETNLFEMDGMLTMASCNYAAAVIGIWVLQDYENEIWTLKGQLRLPAEVPKFDGDWDVLVTCSDEAVLVLVAFGYKILQIDIDGKLVATFHGRLSHEPLRLKQSLVLHTFFPALEGYVVNDLPFM